MNRKRRSKFGHLSHPISGLYMFIFLSLLATSCQTNNEHINFDEVESIKFWYISKDLCFDHDINDCGVILNMEMVKDTTIIDRETIRRYVSIVNQLEPINPNGGYDLKVSSWIMMKKKAGEDRKNIGVCIAYSSGRVLKDDVLMRGNRSSIKQFLDEILYDPLPPDAWTPDFMKAENIE